jgi:lysozyme family protein
MAEFDLAIPIVLSNEGGLVDNPNDPGGLTKYGISKASYPDLDIKNLTVEQATAIYLRDFWLFGGIDSQDVATKMLDSYVNLRHAAIKIAQQIVGAEVDGSYGPVTEDLINKMVPMTFLNFFRYGLAEHYKNIVVANPKEAEFLPGWLRRAAQ